MFAFFGNENDTFFLLLLTVYNKDGSSGTALVENS
jgi:hypothetical protein